ncbi:hypothetical protein CXG81DRAFT_21319, partial [Caulochytrium protostelioides]
DSSDSSDCEMLDDDEKTDNRDQCQGDCLHVCSQQATSNDDAVNAASRRSQNVDPNTMASDSDSSSDSSDSDTSDSDTSDSDTSDSDSGAPAVNPDVDSSDDELSDGNAKCTYAADSAFAGRTCQSCSSAQSIADDSSSNSSSDEE